MRIVYVDGKYREASKTVAPVIDRKLAFAKIVNEIIAVIDGHLIDNDLHLTRLKESLTTAGLILPISHSEIENIQRELIERNGMDQGMIYLQIIGCVTKNIFLKPNRPEAMLIAFCQPMRIAAKNTFSEGPLIATMRESRWINSYPEMTVSLSQVYASTAVQASRCKKAWWVENDKISEGAITAAFIVTHNRTLITRSLSSAFLSSHMRQVILSTCDALKTTLELRQFTSDEALRAREAFIISSSNPIVPVIAIDGHLVHDGEPGPITLHIQKNHLSLARKDQTPRE